MKPVFTVTKGMLPVSTSYCPGCTHGVAHRIIMETLDEMGLLGKTIGVAPIGCSVVAHQFMNVDMCDLASIGMGEIVHAAARGEKFSTFFINNGIYGMTGGQMAPTTLIGQRSTTSVEGRTREQAGMPLRICELLATLDGPAYIERVSLDTPAHIRAAKKAVRKAFEYQLAGKGFTFVELLSTCPTNWGLTPYEAMKRMGSEVAAYYPLGVYKDTGKEAE